MAPDASGDAGCAGPARYRAVMELDLSLPAPDLTARLVDMESVSGAEKPLADEIESALARLPHLVVHRDGNALVTAEAGARGDHVYVALHI